MPKFLDDMLNRYSCWVFGHYLVPLRIGDIMEVECLRCGYKSYKE